MAAQHPGVMDFMPQAVRCLFGGVQKTWFFGCLDASTSPNAAKSWDDPVPTPRPPPYGGYPDTFSDLVYRRTLEVVRVPGNIWRVISQWVPLGGGGECGGGI